MRLLTCDRNDAAGNSRTTREKKQESEKRRVGQMETGMQRKRAREREGMIAFFCGTGFHPVAVKIHLRSGSRPAAPLSISLI